VDGTLQLALAADQGVQLALSGLGDQVRRENGQRVFARVGVALFVIFEAGAGHLLTGADLGDAVGDVLQHVQACDALLLQQVNRVRRRLQVEGRQDVAHVY
jgi:hypothetical protein